MFKRFGACVVAASFTTATLLEDIGLGNLEARRPISPRQKTLANATCRANYSTNLWSSCAQVLSEFNLTLALFQQINPGIGDDCCHFHPGHVYCIAAGDTAPFALPHPLCLSVKEPC